MRRLYLCPPVPPHSSCRRQPVLQVLGCPRRAVSAFAYYTLVLVPDHVLTRGYKLYTKHFVFITYISPPLILHRPYSYFGIIKVKIQKNPQNPPPKKTPTSNKGKNTNRQLKSVLFSYYKGAWYRIFRQS